VPRGFTYGVAKVQWLPALSPLEGYAPIKSIQGSLPSKWQNSSQILEQHPFPKYLLVRNSKV
jgi:hypothetical protein